VFGAGDLALATANIISIAGFSVVVLDDDSSFLSKVNRPTGTQLIDFDDEASYPSILRKDFCLVMTRGHLQDVKVLRTVLKSSPRYIGMIGSEKKNAEVREELNRMNTSDSHWKRIRTPVGLDIGASTPGEIAVAIAAEVVQVKNTENSQED
jgi:xanthine dehydrogenase accessory factor